jgi:hypothetical protein
MKLKDRFATPSRLDVAKSIALLAGAILLLVSGCGPDSHGFVETSNQGLWVAASCCGRDTTPTANPSSALITLTPPGIDEFSSTQYRLPGISTPTPTLRNSSGDFLFPTGVAFDSANNLWVVDEDAGALFEFTATQLKNLPSTPAPTPSKTITSTDFECPETEAFDKNGNLWVTDFCSNRVFGFSPSQLGGAGGSLTPNVILSSADLDGPDGITFDSHGNMWIANGGLAIWVLGGSVIEFTSSQFASSGAPTAPVILTDGGSGNVIDEPSSVAFDSSGALWVANYYDNATEYGNIVKFPTSQLVTGHPTPAVTLSSTLLSNSTQSLDGPVGIAFDHLGDLAVSNYDNDSVVGFSKSQLGSSGSTVPAVVLESNGALEEPAQLTFGLFF